MRTPLTCIDRNGQTETFEYEYEQDQFDPTLWSFRVYTIPGPSSGEHFFLEVKEDTATGTVRISSMAHNNEPAYVAKGIPDALIPEVKKVLSRNVVSSPTQGGPGIYRSIDATKVWKRLEASGLATYDPPPIDVYRLL